MTVEWQDKLDMAKSWYNYEMSFDDAGIKFKEQLKIDKEKLYTAVQAQIMYKFKDKLEALNKKKRGVSANPGRNLIRGVGRFR